MRNVFASCSHRLDQSDAHDFRRKFENSGKRLMEELKYGHYIAMC